MNKSLFLVFVCSCVLFALPSFAQKEKYSKGKRKNGQKVGIWEYVDHKGNLYFHFDYDKKDIIRFAEDTAQRLANFNGEWKEVYLERPPLYNDGIGGIFSHFGQTARYPVEALEQGVSGTVLMEFTIDSTGKTKDFKVIESVSPECDAEAVRVTSTLPNTWHPAMLGGRKVEVVHRMPFIFKLNDN